MALSPDDRIYIKRAHSNHGYGKENSRKREHFRREARFCFFFYHEKQRGNISLAVYPLKVYFSRRKEIKL